MIRLFPWDYEDNAWNVIIKWCPLRKIESYLSNSKDTEASLYALISKDRRKMIYVGMTHRQYAIDRIKNHGYRNCLISTGVMTVQWGKVTKQRVEDTESMLIFICQPKDNTSKMKWIRPKEDIFIENKGLKKYLPKYLYYGTAVKK